MSCCGLVPGIPIDSSFNMFISGNLAVQGDNFHDSGSDYITTTHTADYYNFKLSNPNKGYKFTNGSNHPHLLMKSQNSGGFVGINTFDPSYNLDVSGTFRSNTANITDLSFTNGLGNSLICTDASINNVLKTRYLVVNGVSIFDISGSVPAILYVNQVHAQEAFFTNYAEINDVSTNNVRAKNITASDISTNNLFVKCDISAQDISFNTIQGPLGIIRHIDASDISLNRLQTTNVDISTGLYIGGNQRVIHIDASDISLNRIQNNTFDLSSGFYLNGNARIRHIDCSDISLNRFQTTTVDISTGITVVGNVSATSFNNTPYDLSLASTGNTLIVDQVYGNDTLGASSKYLYKFKTITAALTSASAGENVVVYPGTYNESLTIPDNVSLTGTAAQGVIIQKLGVVQDTSLIVVGNNCRLENFTANLSSSGNYNLTGIHFPSGTSITTKLRNSIWTITSTSTNAPTIVGVYSPGTSATTFTAVNAIQRSSINVISSSTGITRGIYVTGPNRFSVRDMVVYARGTGTNIVGVETTNAGAYAELKTSTISGVLYDINRTAGEILLGFTDLRNNKANGNSFSVVTESSTTTFGILGNMGANQTYYIVPGVIPINSLPASAFTIPISQNMILFSGIANFSGSIGNGNTITLNIYKNAIIAPVYSITLTNDNPKIVNMSQSVDFTQGDTYYATVVTVGNIGTGTFTATLGFY